MTEPAKTHPLERGLEQTVFASRWLIAPFYVGLVLALILLLIVFVRELLHELPLAFTMAPEQGILAVLSLIDLSLAANLLLIVIFSGYENFVSKMNVGKPEDRPGWMGTVDFSSLKMKLIASVVAISGISLLKSFMSLSFQPGGIAAPLPPSAQATITLQIAVHLTFVSSGVLLALMDWLRSKAKGYAED